MAAKESLLLALLAELSGLGPVLIKRLLKVCKTPQEVWKAPWDLWQQAGVPRSLWEGKEQVDYEKEAEKLEAELVGHQISLLSWVDSDYPEVLRELYAPPVNLYYQGNLDGLRRSLIIAVVGTRRASREGKDLAARFAYDLAELGVGIISGLAKGIDGAAHRGALEAGGYSVAVLGGGHGKIYPRQHTQLARELVESNGALVSEYRPSHPPLAPQFKARNRIIAGLAHGVLVVEAPKRSGALLTANFALELGKDVFALPGSPANPNWVGSNNLLKDGAKLVTEKGEILSEFEHLNLVEPSKVTRQFTEVEGKILEVIASSPTSLESLSSGTGLTWGEVIYNVSNLQLNKYISVNSEGRVLPGPLWSEVVSGLQKR